MRGRAFGSLALAATLLCGPVACGDDSPTGTESAFAGTWELEAVDGGPLPWLAEDGLFLDRYLVSARLVVRSRGRVDDIRTMRTVPPGSETTDTLTVPYVLDDSLLTLRRFALSGDDWTDEGTISETQFGTLLTIRVRYGSDRQFGTPDDVTFTYRKIE